MPSVAIVLATFERPSVRRVIDEVLAQAPEDAEVVVVDQSSAAEHLRTGAWCEARGDSRLRWVHHAPASLPAARNVGIDTTTAAVILFFDDDVRLHEGCIEAHLVRYRDPAVGGVVGRIVEQRLQPNASRTTNRVGIGGRVITRLDGPDPVSVHTLKGANMSFRRDALVAAGAFDPGYAGSAFLEDADASVRVRRAGWRLDYEPSAAVDHLHDPVGGVRAGRLDPDWWRFHNTARFVRRHRGWAGLPPFVMTHVGIATWRAARQRSPRTAARLLRALAVGWASP